MANLVPKMGEKWLIDLTVFRDLVDFKNQISSFENVLNSVEILAQNLWPVWIDGERRGSRRE